MDSREIYGLPCVGGKSKLAPYLCEVIEQCAKDYGLNTYISACGGGGKDILSMRGQFFDKFIYNEFETPLAKLMEALTKFSNILPLVDEVDRIIESALKVDVAVDDAEIKQEIQLRAMFQYIYDIFEKKSTEQIEKMSLIELAACGVILVYGSVQNNRKTIYYKSSNGKKSFYDDMYVHSKYFFKAM